MRACVSYPATVAPPPKRLFVCRFQMRNPAGGNHQKPRTQHNTVRYHAHAANSRPRHRYRRPNRVPLSASHELIRTKENERGRVHHAKPPRRRRQGLASICDLDDRTEQWGNASYLARIYNVRGHFAQRPPYLDDVRAGQAAPPSLMILPRLR